MRDIIFRGKRTDNDGWVEGYLFKAENFAFIIPPVSHGTFDTVNEVLKFLRPCYHINPETVGQFTGLTDKNGTRIFEGDIVRVLNASPSPHFQMWEVRFGFHTATAGDPFDCGEAYGFYIFCEQWQDESITDRDAEKFEVVGNIHDNPELLNAEREGAEE